MIDSIFNLPNTSKMISDLQNLEGTVDELIQYIKTIEGENEKLKLEMIKLLNRLSGASRLSLNWDKFGENNNTLIEGRIGSTLVYMLEHEFGSAETYELYPYSDFVQGFDLPSFIGTEEECKAEALRLLTTSA